MGHWRRELVVEALIESVVDKRALFRVAGVVENASNDLSRLRLSLASLLASSELRSVVVDRYPKVN